VKDNRLFYQHYTWARAVVRKYCNRNDVQENILNDCLQEAMIRMWRMQSRYEAGRGTFKSYIYMHLIGAVNDCLRRDNRRVAGAAKAVSKKGGVVVVSLENPTSRNYWVKIKDSTINTGSRKKMDMFDLRDFLDVAVKRVYGRKWNILVLRLLGRSNKEIASLLGTTVGCVQTTSCKAIKELRAFYAKEKKNGWKRGTWGRGYAKRRAEVR